MTIQLAPSYYQNVPSMASNAARGPDASSVQKTAVYETLIAQLESADARVRSHEAAHIAAGGGVVRGGASFGYTKGPDGKMYATSGEVPIDTSEANTPEETVRKARTIAAAALAPADPSPQDFRVAATAALMEMRAGLEFTKELQEKVRGLRAYGVTASSPSGTQSEAA